MSKKARSVGVRELKAHASALLQRVHRGEVIEVTVRGRTVARLIPVTEKPDPMAKLRAAVAAGLVSWSGGKPKGVRRGAPVRGPSVSDAVIEDRR